MTHLDEIQGHICVLKGHWAGVVLCAASVAVWTRLDRSMCPSLHVHMLQTVTDQTLYHVSSVISASRCCLTRYPPADFGPKIVELATKRIASLGMSHQISTAVADATDLSKFKVRRCGMRPCRLQ